MHGTDGPPMSIKLGLLSLLSRQPMHGYALRQEFEAMTGATWPLNIGQVYTTLGRLVRDGLVEEDLEVPESDAEDGQRVYRILDAGRDEVRHWFGTPVAPDAPPRDELAIKLAMAVHTPGVDVNAVIQTQRSATIRSLQQYTRAREAAGDDLSWLLVADALIFGAEAQVRWLDHCETRLVRAARHAAQQRSAEAPPTSDAPRTPASKQGDRSSR